jgi:DNA repair protein RadC
MSATNPDVKRCARYQRVLNVLTNNAELPLAEVKSACAEESPAFVTRVVRELTHDGYLEAVGAGKRAAYRWRRERDRFSAADWIASKVYTDRMTLSPVSDRPRERLLANGAASLRTADLLAILVRSGRAGESALQAGEKIAARYAEELDRLSDAGRGELRKISSAVADTAYCQIMAGIELGRRVAQATVGRSQKAAMVRDTAEAIAFCRAKFFRLAEDGDQEEFHIITLSTKNQVISTHQITVGLLDQCMVHPREVFRPAIKDAAKSIVLVHNHPSGDPTPSDKDLQLTRRLEEVGQLLGIQVLDHIIVARTGILSIHESPGA